MIILALLALGALAGWIAKMIVPGQRDLPWGPTIIAGLLGSLVGGILLNLLFGQGLRMALAGIIGSVLGAVLVLLVWRPAPARRH